MSADLKSSRKIVESCPACGKLRSENLRFDMTQWLFRKACRCGAQPQSNWQPSLPTDSDENEPDGESKAIEFDFGERYDVRQRLGTGGMATVFRVEDRTLNQQFALKAFHKQPWSQDSLQKRVEQEARALTELTHANIANVYGHGETADGVPYLILDWVEGKTLAEIIEEEGRLSEERALNLFIQLAEALQHAHFKGIIHRDLKPSNIVIKRTETGCEQVKVIDFGVAKLMQSDNSDPYTRTGEVFGTPLYMSPEQSQGELIDGRSDIYSLGCVMYEVLTGKPPFRDENAVKVILNHLKAEPKPFRLMLGHNQINPNIEKLVMQCLEKTPQKRYQLMDELLQDLQALFQKSERRFAYVNPNPNGLRRYLASVVDGAILISPLIAVMTIASIAMGNNLDTKNLLSILFCLALLVSIPIPLYVGMGTVMLAINLVATGHQSAYSTGVTLGLMLFTALLIPSYFAGFESSRLMATPGKLLLGLAVVNPEGKRISFRRAALRAYSKSLYLGAALSDYAMRLSLIDKRDIQAILKCLYAPFLEPRIDEMTGTYVINRKALSITHKLELHHPMIFAKLPMERIHFIRQMLIGQCIAGFLYILLGLAICFCISEPGKSIVGALPFVLLTVSLFGPHFYFLWQIQRTRTTLLEKRKREREKLSASKVMHHLRENNDV